MLKILLILTCCLKFGNLFVLRQEQSDIGLNPKQLIEKYGYPLEVHQIHTQDGYILETHRIPHGLSNKNVGAKPVLIMPGVMCSSAIWVNMGPQKSLGFILADRGYDVWLANYRGSTWSRKHETKDPDVDSKSFFDFSYQEMGYYDAPANIDYILNITNQEKLFYIGHSQGTTIFFAMGADRPEYNKKVRLMSALAPVAYISHINNPFFEFIGENFNLIKILFDIFQLYEFLPYHPFYLELAEAVCGINSPLQPICKYILDMVMGPNLNADTSIVPLIASNIPAGFASRSFLHLVQQTKSKKFSHYDFGVIQNFIKYGQAYPPEYNVTKVTAPVALYYSDADSATPIEDVTRLISELPYLVYERLVQSYTHIDYLWAANANLVLYQDIIALMDTY